MMNTVDLIAAHWTIAGDAVPGTDKDFSPFDFKDRVEEAAKAGFKGLSLWHGDLTHVRQTRTLKEIRQILDDNGMQYVELSVLLDWFMEPGERRRASDARRQMFLTVAETLDLRNIRVSDARRTPCPRSRLIDEFARLCEEAALHGSRIAYEIAPFSNIHSLVGARELIEGAGAKNGGVLFDIWHIAKLGIPYEQVWQFPGEHVFGVEVNDGYLRNPPTEDLMEETMHHRLWCGEGEFDVRRFLAYMSTSRYRGPVGVEVCSRELRSWPLQKLAAEAYRTTRAQLPS